MKKSIHPQYNKNVTISCACGNTFISGSTMNEIRVEVCSACHPFYTGKDKLIDTEGRVEKFQKRFEEATKRKAEYEAQLKVKKEQEDQIKQQQKTPKSLKEMLAQAQNK